MNENANHIRIYEHRRDEIDAEALALALLDLLPLLDESTRTSFTEAGDVIRARLSGSGEAPPESAA